MNRIVHAVLAALIVAGAAAPAVARPVAGVAASARTAELDRLVVLLVPDAAMADLAARAFDQAIAQGRSGDAETRAAIARHPGLRAHLAAAVRPRMLRILKRELPALRGEIGAILAAELSDAEVRDAATFFASAAGQKVYAQALRAIGDNPDRDAAQVKDAAMSAVMGSLAPEDYPALIVFGASSAAAKMKTINPRIAAASKAWSERLLAKHGRKMDKLAKRATRRYLARSRRGQ